MSPFARKVDMEGRRTIVVSLAGLLLSAPLQAQPGSSCIVARIIDGDTFSCEGGETIRLLTVDTPEIEDEPFGPLARDLVESLMPTGTEVGLVLDVQERDRYGRVLAYVYLPDDRMVNQLLAQSGFAISMVISPNVRHAESIREAVASARSNGRGLWGIEAFEPLGADLPATRSPEPSTSAQCDPSYPTVCIPPPPPDLDCGDIQFRRFQVVGSDPHRFDGDGDGVGCESG